jgi:hypothetical protein
VGFFIVPGKKSSLLIVAKRGDLKFDASFLKSNFPLHLFHLTYALEVKR